MLTKNYVGFVHKSRERRLKIMRAKYGDLTDILIHGNYRADEMAKEARDNALLEEIPIPNTIHPGERYSIHDKQGNKIFSVRKYLKEMHNKKNLTEVQKLKLMPWIADDKANQIHMRASNNVLLQTKHGYRILL